MIYIKDKHLECIHAKGISLLDVHFTTTRADDGPNGPELTTVDDDHIGPDMSVGADTIDSLNLSLGVVSRDTSAPLQVPVVTAERGVGMGRELWRSLTRSLGTFIKCNSIAQVNSIFRKSHCDKSSEATTSASH